MKKVQKVLALLLVFVMVFTTAGMNVAAAGEMDSVAGEADIQSQEQQQILDETDTQQEATQQTSEGILEYVYVDESVVNMPQTQNIAVGFSDENLVLEFAVPTAVVSLMWVTIYEGNSPLSLSLVVLDTVLAPFLIPATLRILLGSAVTMDPTKMMRELVFMVALPAIVAMTLNQVTDGKVMKTWPGKLAPFSKLALMFVVTSNSSKVAPYIRNMNMQRVKVALAILVLAASGYALGWFVAYIFRKDRSTAVSMMYGTGMRNISAGAVIAAAYFPGEVMFPVMIGTLFQQVLAALFGKLLAQKKEKQEFY